MLLKGIKVLDLSTLLPGPMCSLFLADLGAEVVKVESVNGDFMRSVDAKNSSPYFSALNRSKKSIAVNLKTDEGIKIFKNLARNADVIIEGFRPGKVDSLGLGYKDIKKINPKVIYCSITGYGQKGAYKDKAGHDLNYSALSGLLDAMSFKPSVPGVQVADVGCAIIAAFSIAACLFYRERSKKGVYVDVSVFNSALSLIAIHIAHRSVSAAKTVLSGTKPCYNVYETKDGKYASLGAIEKKFWDSFCSAIKRDDLALKQFDESIIGEIKKIFRSKTLEEWMLLNEKRDFCCEPVKTLKDVINDPYLKKKKMIINLDGIANVAMPVSFSSFKSSNYSKAPKIGENTTEILRSIGFDDKCIKDLMLKGIVK